LLKDDLRELQQEKLNWLFEEIEMQFLNTINSENQEERRKLAEERYLDYFTRLSISSNPLKADLGRFGLDLLLLQFPDL